MVVNRNQLARKYAAFKQISIVEAENCIKDICNLISIELQKGNDVKLHKFGTLKVKNRKAFTGTHPQTGESVNYGATKILHITPAKALKRMLKE